jgi:hypothetical protein
MSSPAPLWRQAYDAAERTVTPRMESLVRTPGFALGVALARRAEAVARSTVRSASARAWHLVNLPAGSDVHRLRAQIGALDREVRRLTLRLENERRNTRTQNSRPLEQAPGQEEQHADRAQPTGGSRPRPARRRAQRPSGS